MTYELVKKLDKAGFPKVREGEGILIEPTNIEDDYLFEPTLSELIEACGDKFGCLAFNNMILSDPIEKKWVCFDIQNKWTTERAFYAPTPDEAVAKLWLHLNKK